MKSDTYFNILLMFVIGLIMLSDSKYSYTVLWILLIWFILLTIWVRKGVNYE